MPNLKIFLWYDESINKVVDCDPIKLFATVNNFVWANGTINKWSDDHEFNGSS